MQSKAKELQYPPDIGAYLLKKLETGEMLLVI